MHLTLVLSALLASAQLPDSSAKPTRSVLSPASLPQPGDTIFDAAAPIAWAQFSRLWVPGTGLAKATFDYDKLTTWDIGSVLAALHSGRILGLLDTNEYRARMGRTLETLEKMPFFRDSIPHKLYNARTAMMATRDGAETKRGYAWSATDLGRFLIWLKIVAEGDSNFTEIASRIVQRIKFDAVVSNGYLYGEDATAGRRARRFQEGRIGYEQYAAHGFAVWGQDVALALDINAHSAPVQVLGVDLLRDTRKLDRLTSEPFVLLGLEVGWNADEETLSRNLLKVQEARFRKTRLLTIASEDAVGIPPYFFYYYCILCSGRSFVIETSEPGRSYQSPRWISTKATFAWHALLPSEYTQMAIDKIRIARAAVGWSSGVMERSGSPTRAYDLNTAAVILEAAAYRKVGRPLLAAARDAATGPNATVR